MRESSIEGKFISTLPVIPGYEIVESKGMLMTDSILSHKKALRALAQKAEGEGCNALVNVRISLGYGCVIIYGEGVIVKEKPFTY